MPDYAKAPVMADDDSKVAATEPQHENMPLPLYFVIIVQRVKFYITHWFHSYRQL